MVSITGLNEALNSYTDVNLFDTSIILAWRGSVAHGTYIPKHIDDKDVIGIVIPGEEYYLGLEEFNRKGTLEITKNEWDIVVYEFKKFIKLLIKSNPNVLSLLWLKDEYYINLTDEGRTLIDHRDKFMSKQVYDSFVGYAIDQLKRMESFHYEGYMGKKRKELVDKFGYDCKNASHLIRLLKMGIEALETGQINVYREDRSELLQIKRGEWKLDKVKSYASKLFVRIEEAKDNTKLPENPDIEGIKRLTLDILKERLINAKELDG